MSKQTSSNPANSVKEAAADADVVYDVSEQIATITLNRPERQNTISGTMLNAVTEYMLKADADRDVRAIILAGSGKFFCAGLDLRGSDISNNLAEGQRKVPSLDLRNTPPTVMHNLNTPTLCALNGSAAGYGLDMALCCDIRVMSNGAKLAAAFTARGIVPESGGTWILPRLLGWSKAAELIFTGRTLSGQESLDLGLVSYLVDADQVLARTREIATEIVGNAPLAVQASKRMMRMGMNETFDDHVHHVFLQLLPLMQSEDFKEGMASFMERRKAEFKGN
ncbi:MAG: enoyl-CoA hydratase/isomerase family protein [Pseudomonadales bacterium]